MVTSTSNVLGGCKARRPFNDAYDHNGAAGSITIESAERVPAP
jgi:hypothetical protein